MTPEAQRIAIAEYMGWIYPGSTCLKSESWNRWIRPKGETRKRVPDYLNDLNAMHEAERILADQQQDSYIDELLQLIVVPAEAEFGATFSDTDTMWVILHSTAAQRAEAFLRTTGKWKEEA